MKKAVILLSGGMDSATTMAIANNRGYELYAMTVKYGQTNEKELKSAEAVANHYKTKGHVFVDLPLDNMVHQSGLIKGNVAKDTGSDVPMTYVPFRNAIFLSIATAWAESIEADYVYLGSNALRCEVGGIIPSAYPDNKPDFISLFQKVMNLGTKCGREGNPIKLRTPLLRFTKKDVVRTGFDLGVPFELTWSCYKNEICGECDACKLREIGFAQAGIKDPLLENKPVSWTK